MKGRTPNWTLGSIHPDADYRLPVLVLGRVEDALAAHEREVVAQLDPAVAALHHGLDLRAVDDHALALLYALPRLLDGGRLDAPGTKSWSNVQILYSGLQNHHSASFIRCYRPYRERTAVMSLQSSPEYYISG